jgi:hypothetical protein
MWFLFVLLDTKLFHTPVSEPDSSEQLSNSGIDFSSNIKEVNFVGDTKTAVAETVGEGYQQVTAASKKTSVNENKTTGKATSQAGNGSELNESGARHTVSNSAEQTSNCVTVVAGEINEIRQVLVEEMVPAGTLAESVQQSPASSEKTTVDDKNSMGEGNGGSETYPEHVITLRSMSNNPDLPSHDENVSGRSSEKLTGIIQDNDGCAGKLTNTSDSDPCIEESKSETPFLQELNEVLDTLDEFVEEFQTTRMRNKSDREGEKKENAKKEGKKEGEKEESNKTEGEKMEGEKMEGEKGSDQGGEKEGEKNVSNKKEGVKEGEKNENEKKEGKKTEGEKKASNNEGEKEGEEKEGGKKESNKKEGVKREGEKKEDEKEGEKKEDEKEGEKKGDGKKEDEKKEDERKEDEKKEGEKKQDEKKQDEKKEGEKKEGEKKEDEKKEGEKKEDEKEGEKKEDEKEGEKKDDEKEGERNEGEKKEGEKKEGKNKEGEKKEVDKKEDDKKEGEKNEDEKGKKQYSKDEKETQKTVISTKNENKKDDEPSEARRTTRSITNAGGVQVSLSNISNIIELNI